MLTIASLCALGYLLGSLSAAIIVSKVIGLADPRRVGSGNPGATNILRYAGKKVATVTLLGDLFKGLIAVKLALLVGLTTEESSIVALMAFLGHLYPVFHNFKGGKGVATLIGVTSALYWQIGLCFILSWLLLAKLSKYSSLSALMSSILLLILIGNVSQSYFSTGCFSVMVILLYFKHQENIKRLLTGKEKKIGE